MSASSLSRPPDNRFIRSECPVVSNDQPAPGVPYSKMKAFIQGAPPDANESGYPTPLWLIYQLTAWLAEQYGQLTAIKTWMKYYNPSWLSESDQQLDDRQADFAAGYGIMSFILSQPAIPTQSMEYKQFDKVSLLDLRTKLLGRSRRLGPNLQTALALMIVNRLLSDLGGTIELDSLRLEILQATQLESTSGNDRRRKLVDQALEKAWEQIMGLRGQEAASK